MRGSVYYQTAQLTQVIFKEGSKKEERVNPNHEFSGCVSSYQSMETYRKVWNNFFNYLYEHWSLKNCELITSEHVEAYFEYKIEYYPSQQYAEKLSAALGKLEVALNKYSKAKYDNPIVYDFQVRQTILSKARDLNLIANNYKNRTYQNPQLVISHLLSDQHKLAATIQLEGGARSEGVTFIKKEQLKGKKEDPIAKRMVGVVETKEKGGKVGDILVSVSTYDELESFINESKQNHFKIKYQSYAKDIRNACLLINVLPKGSHGFRWNFAQNRVREYQRNGYTYEQAIQGVSWEMKHYRATITEHYIGGR